MSKNLFEEFALMIAAVSAPLPVPATAITSENGINPASAHHDTGSSLEQRK